MHSVGRIAGIVGVVGIAAAALTACGRSERDSREERDSTLDLVADGIKAATKDELTRSEVTTLARAAHMVPDEQYYEAGVRMGSAYVELEPTIGTAAAVEGAQFVGAFPDVTPETYAAAFENLQSALQDELPPEQVGTALMRYQIYSEDPLTAADGTSIGQHVAPMIATGGTLEALPDQEMVDAIDAGTPNVL